MRILEIEQLFQTEDTLVQVLEKLSDDFARIDEYAEMAKSNVYATADKVSEVLIELSGCHSNLITVLGVAESEKKNREQHKYSNIKIEFDNAAAVDEKGKLIKFTSTIAEKEASDFVSSYRRIRNIIKAYKDSCATSISVLQSVLKDLKKEWNSSTE